MDKTKWHPAFLQAIQLEFLEYLDSLEFKQEFQLTAEPLRIDLLIVKKPKELIIKKNIGQIFRTDNIIEYKSPKDYLSVKDFLKVYAYANLYAAITPNIELSDITLTMVAGRTPTKLIKYLKETRGYRVENVSVGIWHIQGDYLPIQIIQTNKLSDKENLWLNSLRYDLEKRNAGVIIDTEEKLTKKVPMDALIYVLFRANSDVFKEVLDMTAKTKKRRRTFEEVFTEAGYIPEWMERGAKIEREKADKERQKMVLNWLAMGIPAEKVAQAMELPLEKVKEYASAPL